MILLTCFLQLKQLGDLAPCFCLGFVIGARVRCDGILGHPHALSRFPPIQRGTRHRRDFAPARRMKLCNIDHVATIQTDPAHASSAPNETNENRNESAGGCALQETLE